MDTAIPATIMARQKNIIADRNVVPGRLRSPIPTGKAGMTITVIAGLILLTLAVPRTIAAFLVFPGSQTVNILRMGETVDDKTLKVLIASRQRAAGWVETASIWNDLALAELAAAETDDIDRQHVRQASEYFEKSLRLAPARPYAWARRAHAELQMYGPSEAAASALTMSMLTARYEPELIFARLWMSVMTWPHFADGDRELVLDQIRLAWRQSPDQMLSIAMDARRIEILRAALAGSPDMLDDMERRLTLQN